MNKIDPLLQSARWRYDRAMNVANGLHPYIVAVEKNGFELSCEKNSAGFDEMYLEILQIPGDIMVAFGSIILLCHNALTLATTAIKDYKGGNIKGRAKFPVFDAPPTEKDILNHPMYLYAPVLLRSIAANFYASADVSIYYLRILHYLHNIDKHRMIIAHAQHTGGRITIGDHYVDNVILHQGGGKILLGEGNYLGTKIDGINVGIYIDEPTCGLHSKLGLLIGSILNNTNQYLHLVDKSIGR